MFWTRPLSCPGPHLVPPENVSALGHGLKALALQALDPPRSPQVLEKTPGLSPGSSSAECFRALRPMGSPLVLEKVLGPPDPGSFSGSTEDPDPPDPGSAPGSTGECFRANPFGRLRGVPLLLIKEPRHSRTLFLTHPNSGKPLPVTENRTHWCKVQCKRAHSRSRRQLDVNCTFLTLISVCFHTEPTSTQFCSRRQEVAFDVGPLCKRVCIRS